MHIRFALGALAAMFAVSAWASPVTGADQYPAPQASTLLQLQNYNAVLSTLKSGARVRVVANYAKCQLDGKPAPNALGSMNFDTFEYFGAGLIGNKTEFFAASETHLIRRRADFVEDYVRFVVTPDQGVEVDVVYLDPKTSVVSVDEKILCKIDDGSGTAGVTFWKQ